MARVLLLEPRVDDREWFVDALRRAGHVVFAPSELRATPVELGMVDVVVADLEVAIASGWVREGGTTQSAKPLVVTSSVASFLAKIAPQVAATIAKPTKAKAIAKAVERALGGQRRSEHPPPSEAGGPLDDPARDAEIARRGWTEGSTDAELFAVADLVARGTNAPMALVTIVGTAFQTFVGHFGIPSDLAFAGGSARSWSFCQHAVRSREPLVVRDARTHPSLASSPLVELDMVRAYAGVPVEVPGFGAVGTVCVLSKEPRDFSSKDLAILDLGAKLVGARLASRPPMHSHSHATTTTSSASRDASAVPVVAPGDLVDGKYWVTARLGKGGQSDVFLARDRRTTQLVALKVLRQPDAGDAWLDEAATLARVRHPSIVQLYGWGRIGSGAASRAYLVLEHIEGDTLREVLFESRATGTLLTTARVSAIVRDLAGALETLHSEQLVHGDVKPSNVILEPKLDRAVLLDFGLGLGPRGGATLVRGGTPGFSAPEQFTPDASVLVGPRLDVYALGAITYAMLTGDAPFGRVRGLSRAAAQMRGDIARPSSLRPGLAVTVDDVLLAALSPDPDKRPASVMAFADDLEGALAASRASANRLARAGEAGAAPLPQTRGVSFKSYRTQVRRLIGAPAEEALIAALAEEHRATFSAVIDDAEYYPADALVAYLRAYARGDLVKVEALGELVAAESLPAVVRAMKIARTPSALLHIAPPLMHRFHDWARLEVSLVDVAHARSTLWMPREFAPEVCSYFGGVLKGLLAISGKSAQVDHSACVADGASACQADIRWARDSSG